MKDPIRLRDAKSPHARAARDLLRSAAFGRPAGSGISVRGLAGPSLDQRDAMWASLVAAVGPVGPPPGDGPGGDGPSGGQGGPAGAGGIDAGAATAASGAAKVAATTSAATAQVAATTSAATAAAPTAKVAFSLGAAKLWLALGIGGVASIGTAAYVTSPASPPASVPERDAAVAWVAPETGTGASRVPSVTTPETSAAPPSPEVVAEAPTARDDLAGVRPTAAVPAAPRVSGSIAAPVAQVEPRPEPSPAPVASLTPAERASRLRDEAKATADARVALRSGDASGALRLLADAARAFGGGSMGQEREALTIEALARSGARDAASARAESFLARWPGSAYAAAVRPYAAEPNSK